MNVDRGSQGIVDDVRYRDISGSASSGTQAAARDWRVYGQPGAQVGHPVQPQAIPSGPHYFAGGSPLGYKIRVGDLASDIDAGELWLAIWTALRKELGNDESTRVWNLILQLDVKASRAASGASYATLTIGDLNAALAVFRAAWSLMGERDIRSIVGRRTLGVKWLQPEHLGQPGASLATASAEGGLPRQPREHGAVTDARILASGQQQAQPARQPAAAPAAMVQAPMAQPAQPALPPSPQLRPGQHPFSANPADPAAVAARATLFASVAAPGQPQQHAQPAQPAQPQQPEQLVHSAPIPDATAQLVQPQPGQFVQPPQEPTPLQPQPTATAVAEPTLAAVWLGDQPGQPGQLDEGDIVF